MKRNMTGKRSHRIMMIWTAVFFLDMIGTTTLFFTMSDRPNCLDCECIPQNISYNLELLKILLTRSQDFLCTYVEKETSILPMERYSDFAVKELGRKMDDRLKLPDYSIVPLLHELFKLNRFQADISFASNKEAGYVVLTEDPMENMEGDARERWDQFYLQYPDADGITWVSIPVIDRERGILVYYKGVVGHPLAGNGWIIVYKIDQDDQLVELLKWMVWLS